MGIFNNRNNRKVLKKRFLNKNRKTCSTRIQQKKLKPKTRNNRKVLKKDTKIKTEKPDKPGYNRKN